MITLYDMALREERRPSPFCWRTKLALQHKGLEWRTEPVGFNEKAKIAFADSTTVPVIRDEQRGGKAVKDSWAIAQYLEETYPERPLFGPGQGRAFAHFTNSWLDTTVHPALFPLVVLDIWSWVTPEDQAYFRESREKRLGTTLELGQAAAREKSIPAFRASLEPARRSLAERPFLSGARPAYPDYALMGTMMWIRTICSIPLLAPDDTIAAWQERMLDELDGFCRAAPCAYTA